MENEKLGHPIPLPQKVRPSKISKVWSPDVEPKTIL